MTSLEVKDWNNISGQRFQFSSNETTLILNFLKTEISTVQQIFSEKFKILEERKLFETKLFEFGFSFYSF